MEWWNAGHSFLGSEGALLPNENVVLMENRSADSTRSDLHVTSGAKLPQNMRCFLAESGAKLPQNWCDEIPLLQHSNFPILDSGIPSFHSTLLLRWCEYLFNQFLIEAIALSVTGGAIGILIGWGGALIINNFFPATVTLWAVGLAFGVSAGVGIIFGVAPAVRASKLNPIDALRYE